MELIYRLVMPDAKFVHICDYFHEGIRDGEWIPRLAAEGGWVVISSDGAKQSGKGDKLPDLCREYGIPHVVLSATLHAKSSRDKAAAITAMWAQIATVVDAPPGTRFQLRFRSKKGTPDGVALTLQEVPRPAPPPTAEESP